MKGKSDLILKLEKSLDAIRQISFKRGEIQSVLNDLDALDETVKLISVKNPRQAALYRQEHEPPIYATLTQKKGEMKALEQSENVKAMRQLIPSNYATSDAISFFIVALETQQASSLPEAIKLYENKGNKVENYPPFTAPTSSEKVNSMKRLLSKLSNIAIFIFAIAIIITVVRRNSEKKWEEEKNEILLDIATQQVYSDTLVSPDAISITGGSIGMLGASTCHTAQSKATLESTRFLVKFDVTIPNLFGIPMEREYDIIINLANDHTHYQIEDHGYIDDFEEKFGDLFDEDNFDFSDIHEDLAQIQEDLINGLYD